MIIESGIYYSFPYKPKLLISGELNLFKSGEYLNACGIYALSGLYISETVETPYYIGSSVNLKKRIINHHLGELRYDHHYNPILQKAYNKYGEDQFVWWLLEECNAEDSLSREQWYLDNLRPFADENRGYNISHDATSGIKGRKHKPATIEKMKKRVFSEETRKKMSIARKGWKPSEETRKKYSERSSGKNNSMYGVRLPQETIDRLTLKKSKPFKFIAPDGSIIEGLNLRKFCRDNNLNQGAMSSLKAGKIRYHKGYTRYIEN